MLAGIKNIILYTSGRMVKKNPNRTDFGYDGGVTDEISYWVRSK